MMLMVLDCFTQNWLSKWQPPNHYEQRQRVKVVLQKEIRH